MDVDQRSVSPSVRPPGRQLAHHAVQVVSEQPAAVGDLGGVVGTRLDPGQPLCQQMADDVWAAVAAGCTGDHLGASRIRAIRSADAALIPGMSFSISSRRSPCPASRVRTAAFTIDPPNSATTS